MTRPIQGLMTAVLTALIVAPTAYGAGPATGANTQKTEQALFASGCFWKTQYIFSKVPGVTKTVVGYTGGTKDDPTYKEVCSSGTGHAETALVEYDPKKTSYNKLLEVFFANHDPTTLNRQGPDSGTQYRSAIFYKSPEQKLEATKYKEKLESEHKFAKPIVTEIKPAGKFYPAETYHQDYYVKHGKSCF